MSPEQYEAVAKTLRIELLAVLPDSAHEDAAWRFAWNSLPPRARESVTAARERGEEFVADIID